MTKRAIDHDYELLRRVEQFLYKEASLLDQWELLEWLNLLSQDIDYRIPIRSTLENERDSQQFSSEAFHMVEDIGSLTARMKRLDSGFAFSEAPRSRVRRHISNICIDSQTGSEIKVSSYLLFFWARDGMERVVSAQRHDTLRDCSEHFQLARRVVLLDHVVLPIPNLTVVL